MNRLFRWRTKEGLSRAEAAERFEVSAETVRRWEVGERIPEKEKMSVIYTETRGFVDPSSFYFSDGDAA